MVRAGPGPLYQDPLEHAYCIHAGNLIYRHSKTARLMESVACEKYGQRDALVSIRKKAYIVLETVRHGG